MTQPLDSPRIEADELLVEIGARIKLLRRRYRFSLEEAAQKLGMSKSALSQVENGVANLSVANLLKIARFFGKDIGYLWPSPAPSEVFKISRMEQRKDVHQKQFHSNLFGNEDRYTTLHFSYGMVDICFATVRTIDKPAMQFDTHMGSEYLVVLNGRVEFVGRRNKDDNQ